MRQLVIAIVMFGAILAGQTGASRADDLADCNSGEPDRVIAGCTKLLDEGRLKPRYQAEALNLRGMAFHNTDLLDLALADFTRAIAINPEHFGAYNNRATVLMSKRQYAQALPDLDSAIALNPESWEVYVNRGAIHTVLGRHDRAIADYSAALEIKPDNAWAFNNRAYAHMLNGEPDKALADIDAALALDPDNARMHHSLGEIYFYAGQEDRATEAWETVCRLASAEVSRMWQRNLALRGHYSGDIDGRCDDRLIDAFRSCAREKCFLHS